VIGGGTPDHIEYAAGCADAFIGHAEHQPLHASVDQCPGTHGARLHGHIQRRTGQTIVPDDLRGAAQRDDLGMGGRITTGNRPVPAFRDDAPVLNQ